MWDIVGDSWNESDIHGGVGILENPTLTLDEPKLEGMVIGNASTSVTTSESEVQSETIDLKMRVTVVFDCLEHLSFILF